MARLTIFAKGNLDVRDSLHSCILNGRVLWNGINEIVRARYPGTSARVRHQTWTRSDALVDAGGTVPPELAARALPLGPYPLSGQFDGSLFSDDADVFVLSLQPDLVMPLVRHRRDGYVFYPYDWQRWPKGDRAWLHAHFDSPSVIDVAASMRNLERIVARLQGRSSAPILIYNMSAVVPGDTVHCHAGFEDLLATRIRRFNLGLAELSQRTAISVIDVDAIVARAGADRVKFDAMHLTAEGCRLIAQEVVRVLDDLGLLPQEGHS